MRLEGTRHWSRLADGRIHIGHEISGIGGIKIGCLAGVHDRTATNGHVAIEISFGGKLRGGHERLIRRLDAYLII